MNKLIDLGYCLARLGDNFLLIVSPDDVGDVYCPASCVKILGKENLISLRDALNEMFPEDIKKED